ICARPRGMWHSSDPPRGARRMLGDTEFQRGEEVLSNGLSLRERPEKRFQNVVEVRKLPKFRRRHSLMVLPNWPLAFHIARRAPRIGVTRDRGQRFSGAAPKPEKRPHFEI